jgi:glutamate N-acetyltransferase/amino-acid N-acetyltransferase
MSIPFDEAQLRAAMAERIIAIAVDLGMGRSGATIYTTDFTYDYVKINAEYTT